MNGHAWLYQATRDMPEVVTQRVTAETLAHLQEAGLSNAADVLPLLGDPEETAEGLRWLYLTRKELEEVQTGGGFRTGLNLSEWLAGLVLPAVLLSATWQGPTPWRVLLLVAYALILALTHTLNSVRRRHWRLWVAGGCAAPVFFFSDFAGTLGSSQLAAALLLVGLPYGLSRMLRQDARLRRTLALQGERA